jgi:hypothetical protein
VTLSDPDVLPVPAGEKFTATVHDAPPPASVLPQVVLPKSTTNTPLLVERPLMVTVPPAVATLLLVTVTNLSALVVPCGTVPKLSDVGESTSADSVPVPLSVIDAGLFLALLVKVKAPVTRPCAVGEKVTVTVQLLFAATVPVHPSVAIANGPEVATPVIVAPTELGFVTVAVEVGLVEPTRVLGNVIVGEKLIKPFTPAPLSVTNCGLLGAVEGNSRLPLKFPIAVAVKVVLTVHIWPLASVTPEHVSDVIMKFGDGERLTGPLGFMVVVEVIVPIVIGPPD